MRRDPARGDVHAGTSSTGVWHKWRTMETTRALSRLRYARSQSRQPSSPLTTVSAPDGYQVHHHCFFRLAVQLMTTVMGEGGVSMAVLMRNRSPSRLGT